MRAEDITCMQPSGDIKRRRTSYGAEFEPGDLYRRLSELFIGRHSVRSVGILSAILSSVSRHNYCVISHFRQSTRAIRKLCILVESLGVTRAKQSAKLHGDEVSGLTTFAVLNAPIAAHWRL